MPDVALSCSLEKQSVLPHEAFWVVVEAKSLGAASVELPDPDGPVPFVHRLFSEDEGELCHNFSAKRYRVVKDPNARRSPGLPPRRLGPGGVLRYRYDFAGVLSEDVRPGRYAVEVSLGVGANGLVAPRVPLEVLPPRAVALVAVAQDVEGGSSGLLAAASDGGTRVMQWDAQPKNATLLALREREVVTGSVTDMAAGLDNPEHMSERWFAWLADGQLTAIRTWDRSLSRRCGPIKLELQEPRLLAVGRKLANGDGQFLVAGQGLVRRLVLEGEVVPEDSGEEDPDATPGLVAPPDPSGPPRLESHDHAWPGGALPQHLQARYQPDGGIQLVGVVQDGDTCRVVVAELGDGPLEPRTCFELEAPCSGLAVPPWQEAGEGYADALFGPLGEDDAREYVFVRLPLDEGAAEAREWRFAEAAVLPEPKPEDEEAVPSAIEGWQLCRGPAAHPPLAARVGPHFLLGWPSKGGKSWEPLGGELAADARLRLLACARPDAYKRKLYALLIDPVAGMRTLPLGR